jgi:hypothetical protein
VAPVSIRDALTQITTIQKGLRISDPVVAQVKEAYKLPPPRSTALNTPCWINAWTLSRLERRLTGGVVRHFYTIHCQLLVEDADLDRGADIATALGVAFITTMNGNITVGGTVSTSLLRGADPTIGLLEWSGKSYPGLDLFLDCELNEGVSFH